mmetsp:Transcript_18214/g.41467  ORF Transcript_18214/g.41467 Transcript_18214/m.41467 type:complete len:135 (+) Transcript_18214:736-1140(+)
MLHIATGLRLRAVLPLVAALGRTPCTKTGRAATTRGLPSSVPERIITGVTHLRNSPPAGATPGLMRTGVVAMRTDSALRGGDMVGVYGVPGLAGDARSLRGGGRMIGGVSELARDAMSSSGRAAASSSCAVAFH